MNQAIFDQVFTSFFVNIGITAALGIGQQYDFKRTKYLGRLSRAQQSHGKLSARQVFLHQNRLVVLL